MNPSYREVLHYLTGCADLHEVSVEVLQKLVEESPYFPVTHFFLAKKFEAENHPGFTAEVQKTALYYSNVYWLHYQLMHEDEFELDTKKSTAAEDKEARSYSALIVEQPLQDDKTKFHEQRPSIVASNGQTTDDETQPLPTTPKPDGLPVVSHASVEDNRFIGEATPVTHKTDAKNQEELNQLDTKEEAVTRDKFEQNILNELSPAEAEETIEVSEEMAGVISETNEITEAFLHEAEISAKESDQGDFSKNQTTEVRLDNVDSVALNELGAVKTKQGSEEGILSEHAAVGEVSPGQRAVKEEKTDEPDEHERMFQNIKAMLDASSEQASGDPGNATIPIDPYYTIDYFASQGIKLDLEQNPQDQLGKSLKKFTHWLRHMKKLGPEDATEAIIRQETETETEIVKIADYSNTTRQVVTEAMASVLEKQGKKEKAIELYTKLSFLNPDKSAYFAHKIKNLKGNSR